MFRQDTKILMLQRKNTGFQDGNYSLPAGHVDGGESLVAAAKREILEEVDLNVSTNDLNLVHVLHRKSAAPENSDERVDFYFEASTWSGEVKNMEPEKCGSLDWFELDALPTNIVPPVKHVLSMVAQGLPYSDLGWDENETG